MCFPPVAIAGTAAESGRECRSASLRGMWVIVSRNDDGLYKLLLKEGDETRQGMTQDRPQGRRKVISSRHRTQACGIRGLVPLEFSGLNGRRTRTLPGACEICCGTR